MLDSILQELYGLSYLEIIGVIGGLLYTFLAARQKKICWIFGGISTLAYTFLFFRTKVYFNSLLNLYFTFIAVYGWWVWSGIAKKDAVELVNNISKKQLIYLLISVTILTPILSLLFQKFTNHPFPYIDSFVSLLSLWAAFLAAKKVLENWPLWIVADLVALYMFWKLNLYFTCFLFVVYILNAFYAWYSWNNPKTAKK